MDKVKPAPQAVAGYGANPFINRTRVLPFSQRVKIAVLGCILLPIRALLMLLLVLFAAIIAAVGTFGMRPPDYELPLPAWRAVILAPLRPAMRALLAVMGVWVTVRGHPAPRAAAPIVVCNHRCFLEPIFLMASLGGSAVSAAENSRYPLVGPILVALQSILVQRDHRQKKKADPAQAPAAEPPASPAPSSTESAAPLRPATAIAKITARALDARFGRVLIFPEGTCGNGEVVLQFKVGAFAPGLPVQPVTVEYPWHHFDVSWCSDDPSVGVILLRLLCQVYTPMTVTYLPVVTPTPAERADASLYAANVQAFVARALGVPATAHSYDDYLLAHAAKVGRFPPEIGVVEIQALRNFLDVDTKKAEEYLKLFMRADTERSGRISADQFAEIFLPSATPAAAAAATDATAVASPPPPPRGGALVRAESFSAEDARVNPQRALRRLFTLLDTDGNGWLNYREFLVGLSVVNERSRGSGRTDALRMAFKIIDSSGRGAISQEQFRRILLRAWPEMDAAVADAAFAAADADRDGRLTMAEFVAWGDAHSEHLPVFRQVFMGWTGEDDMLAKRRAAAQPQEPASAQVAAAASDAPAAEAPSTPANPDKGEAGSAGKPLRRRT